MGADHRPDDWLRRDVNGKFCGNCRAGRSLSRFRSGGGDGSVAGEDLLRCVSGAVYRQSVERAR